MPVPPADRQLTDCLPTNDATAVEQDGLLGILRFVLPFGALYMAFGMTFALIGTAAPLVLRARGMPLAEVGLVQIVYLPVGLSFLWAPLLDRWKFPGFPRRVGWIVAGQVTTILLLFALSQGEHWPVALLFVLGFLTCMAAATMDVSVEALVVETVKGERRPPVTTTKLCAIAIGGTIGISLATVLPKTIGLPEALMIVAGLDVLLLIPIISYPETARRHRQPQTSSIPRLRRLRAVAGRAVALGGYFAVALMLGESSTLVLVDLHLPLPLVGFLTGAFTTVLTITMTLASGVLTARFASHRLITTFAGGAAIGGCLTLVATACGWAWLGVLGAIVNIACTAGLGVPIYNMIYRWAEGTEAATDYALLFGCAFLTSVPARLGAPALAGKLGWPGYFAVAVPLYLAAIALLVTAIRGTPPRDVPAG